MMTIKKKTQRGRSAGFDDLMWNLMSSLKSNDEYDIEDRVHLVKSNAAGQDSVKIGAQARHWRGVVIEILLDDNENSNAAQSGNVSHF